MGKFGNHQEGFIKGSRKATTPFATPSEGWNFVCSFLLLDVDDTPGSIERETQGC